MPPARRYFRLFKWIDCWTTAYNQYHTHLAPSPVSKPASDVENIKVVLTVAKFSLLGMYLFLEMFTLVSTAPQHVTHCTSDDMLLFPPSAPAVD